MNASPRGSLEARGNVLKVVLNLSISGFAFNHDNQMVTDSAISLSSSGSSSLNDVLPDLRKAEITKRRTRADSLSSALSSLPDSDASSDLSDLTDSETDQPARKRQRKEYTPEPLSDSGDSEREDAPGSKQYLKAGLYSVDNKDGLADASFTISIEKISVEALSAVPLALAASVPAEQGSPNPELEEDTKPRESRRASSIANQKFARNGSGPSTIHAKQKAPKKKALPANTILTDYVPTGSLLSLPINYGEHLIEQERDFKLSFDILRDYSSGCIKRQRVFERAGADKRPPKYWQIKQSQCSSCLAAILSEQTSQIYMSRETSFQQRYPLYVNASVDQAAARTVSTGKYSCCLWLMDGLIVFQAYAISMLAKAMSGRKELYKWTVELKGRIERPQGTASCCAFLGKSGIASYNSC